MILVVAYFVGLVVVLVPVQRFLRHSMDPKPYPSSWDSFDEGMSWLLAFIVSWLWPVAIIALVAVGLSRFVWSFLGHHDAGARR